ncbi:hypothetical protein C8J56DRAFT_1054048 [Mycena floridula]|nr:hypothetical protein C8J56DRAFT_1054048 [Mycena floridula]
MLLLKIFLNFILSVFTLRSAQLDVYKRYLAPTYMRVGTVIDGVAYVATFKPRKHDVMDELQHHSKDSHRSSRGAVGLRTSGMELVPKQTTLKKTTELVVHEVKSPISRYGHLSAVSDPERLACLFLSERTGSRLEDRPHAETGDESVFILVIDTLSGRFGLMSVSLEALWKSLQSQAWTCISIGPVPRVQQQLLTCIIAGLGLLVIFIPAF